MSGYNSDNLHQGMNIWFEKLAGAAAAESAMSMVQVVAFDYEADGIEMHLTGKLELGRGLHSSTFRLNLSRFGEEVVWCPVSDGYDPSIY